MRKKQHTVKLTPVTEDGEFRYWTDEKNLFQVWPSGFGSKHRTLVTQKGAYDLEKHPSANRFQGKCLDTKVHFTHKVEVAKLIYWA